VLNFIPSFGVKTAEYHLLFKVVVDIRFAPQVRSATKAYIFIRNSRLANMYFGVRLYIPRPTSAIPRCNRAFGCTRVSRRFAFWLIQKAEASNIRIVISIIFVRIL
jgi:hypothetical protein